MMEIVDCADEEGYELRQFCPLCGNTYKLQLSLYEKALYDDYCESGGYIQETLSMLNPVEREFILTGYCPDCQKLIFDNGETNRIKPLKQTSAAVC